MSPLISGAQLAVPNYGRIDLATPGLVITTSTLTVGAVIAKTDEGSVIIPLSLFAKFTSSATVSSRTCCVAVLNEANQHIELVPAPTQQAASLTGNYTWTAEVGAGYGFTGAVNVAPLPPVVMLPGWSLAFEVFGAQAGDLWTAGASFSYLRIPTGPELPESGQVLAPIVLGQAPPAPKPAPAPSAPPPFFIGPPTQV